MKNFAKNSKKILAALLALIMVCSCMIVAVYAEDPLVLAVTLEADQNAKTIKATVKAPDGYELDTDSLDFAVSPTALMSKNSNTCLFYNLEYGKYTVTVTAKVTKNNGAIEKIATGAAEKVLEKKDATSKPEGLMVTAITDSSIEVTEIEGALYSLNNGDYTTSNKFESLVNGQAYTISAKFKETEDTKESDIVSIKAILDTKVATASYSNDSIAFYGITNNTNKTITVYPAKGEITKIVANPTAASQVQDDGSYLFYNLTPDKEYTFTANEAEEAAIKLTLVDLTRTAPADFKIITGTADSVAVTSYTNAEYTIDDWATTQESNIFQGLTAGNEYTIKVRYKATETTPVSYESTLTYKALSSKSAPKASDVKLESCTATTITLTSLEGAEYSILNGAPWQDSPTFTGLTAGVEYTVQVRYKATETSNESEAVQVKVKPLAEQNAPANFAVTGVTKTSITVTKYATGDVEYSKDNGSTWQDSETFLGLAEGAEYTILARYKETPTKQAGKTATVKATPSAISIVLTPNTATKVIHVAITYDENYTLKSVSAIDVATSATAGDTLPDDPASKAANGTCEFDVINLTLGKTYKVTATVVKGEAESTVSQEVELVKYDCTKTVSGFKATSVTATSVTLTKIDGVEYSMDGETFVANNTFDGLTTGKEYTFYARYAETDTVKAGAAASCKATPKTTTNAPVLALVSRDTTSVTVTPISGAEYTYTKSGLEISNDAKWVASNKFTGLEDGTKYDFYARIPETATAQASPVSSALTVTTIKKGNTEEAKDVVLENVDQTKIVVKTVKGYEYKIYIDGKDSEAKWQDSPEFTKLEPDTNYCIVQREKVDTTVQEPSKTSKVKKVKTNSAAPNIIDEASLKMFTLTTDNGKYEITAESVKKSTTDKQWGDIQFIPVRYEIRKGTEVVKTGSFTSKDSKTYTASGSVTVAGDYTAAVIYEKQKYTATGTTGFEGVSEATQLKTFTVVNSATYYAGKVLTFLGTTMPKYMMKFFDWLRNNWDKIMSVFNIVIGANSGT